MRKTRKQVNQQRNNEGSDKKDPGSQIIVETNEYLSGEQKKINGAFNQNDSDPDVLELIANAKALATTLVEETLAVQTLSAQLAEISSSQIWKTALFLVQIQARIAPPNSQRARILRSLMKVVYDPIKKIRSYRNKSLKNDIRAVKDAQTYPEERKWNKLIDSAAQVALQAFLDRLKIPQKSDEVLSRLKTTTGSNRYAHMLGDLFSLVQVLCAAHNSDPIQTLVQASKLPEIADSTRRRHILFITTLFPSSQHGGGNRVLNFIKILSRNNDIYLSTAFDPENDAKELKNLETLCHSIQTIPYNQFGKNQAKILHWLNGTQMDIVHYEWPRAMENFDPGFGPIQIFTYMEAVSLRLQMDLDQLQPLSGAWLEKFAEFIHALRVELVDAAQLTTRITVTTKDGNYFRDLYPYQTYAVLNHGVIFDEFCLADIEPEPHTLVFVGNYEHYPNADAMLFFLNEIWPVVCHELPDARIYIVGPNPPETITRFADARHVIITGAVPDHRVYIQKASVGIAPLINGAGMRGKVIDYAALRRTFVATSIAMTDLVFEDGLDFYRADTAQEFSQKIIDLLKDAELADKMSATAFNTARQNYDMHSLTDFMVRLYEHLETQKPNHHDLQ